MKQIRDIDVLYDAIANHKIFDDVEVYKGLVEIAIEAGIVKLTIDCTGYIKIMLYEVNPILNVVFFKQVNSFIQVLENLFNKQYEKEQREDPIDRLCNALAAQNTIFNGYAATIVRTGNEVVINFLLDDSVEDEDGTDSCWVRFTIVNDDLSIHLPTRVFAEEDLALLTLVTGRLRNVINNTMKGVK